MTLIFNQCQYKETRRLLRNNSTDAEKFLWQRLKGCQLGAKFRRQYGIGRYIVDFCVPRKKLVIEIDGGIHLSKCQKLYDKTRQRDLEDMGFNIIRFTNEEILENTNNVLKKIKQKIISNNL